MIKAVIFDFDGVIVESAGIKTSAFQKLFERDYPDKVREIVDYHRDNMGVSRFIKFRHIYEKILNMPLSAGEVKKLGERFSEIVLEEIICAPLVAGAEKFIVDNQNKYLMFIASGTPEEELFDIVNRRKIRDLFKEVHGTPASKTEIIKGILNRYHLKKDEAVFVGDATSDLKAAKESGIAFIARLNSENMLMMEDEKWNIKNLVRLGSILASIEKESGYKK